MNKREAVGKWVNEDMSAISTTMIRDMISADIGDFCDVTPYEDESERPCDYDYGLPMWGWMWQFKSSFDDDWLDGFWDNPDHYKEMRDCGFHVWSSNYGTFFGIDGAGYDFYEAH